MILLRFLASRELLIAHEFIPKGTVTWKLVPGFDAVLSDEELEALPSLVQEHIRYYAFFHPDLKRYIFCADDDRFTNHSDEANQRFCGDHTVAVRDIAPGEELTDNYNELGSTLCEATRPPLELV